MFSCLSEEERTGRYLEPDETERNGTDKSGKRRCGTARTRMVEE